MDKRRVVVLTLVAVFMAAMAFGSVWPFLNAWDYHDNPAWTAARDWATGNADLEAIVGPKSHLASDMFPSGGENGTSARYEFKVEGDEGKKKVRVLLQNQGGAWVVTTAQVEDGEFWRDISPHGVGG